MADTKLTPNPGALGVTGQPVALILDGPERTEINDFRGRSASKVLDEHIEIEVIDSPPRGSENEPHVLGVLASVITHNDQDKPTIDRGPRREGRGRHTGFFKW
jgi:hypothetical protein